MIRTALVVAVLICGLAASSFVIGHRARVESANNAVEIVVDYGEVEQIAASTGRKPSDVLKAFKQKGAVSVAVTEQTVADLIDSRRMVPYGEHQFALEERLGRRVYARLQAALEDGERRVGMTSLSSTRTCYVTTADDIPLLYLAQIPVGLPEEALSAARTAEMGVVARLINYPGATARAIDSTFRYLKSSGVRTVIFQGDQVLGFKGGVEYTAKALRKTGMVFGRVEFAKQKGEVELANSAPANVVIVHSIPQNEMPALDSSSIVERFQRAARERGARLCYIRIYDTSSNNLVGDNSDYLAKISDALQEAGFSLRNARPLDDAKVPHFVRIAAGAGVGAGIVLLILALFDLSVTASLIWGIGSVALCAALAGTGYTGRNLSALLAAMTFPTLATLYLVRACPEVSFQQTKPMLKALGRVLSALLVTAVGGVIISGLLSERSYMLRSHQFVGVKAAHMAPILILAVLFCSGIAWHSDTWTQQRRRLEARFRGLLASPLLMWQAGLGLVLLLVFGFMVARSGNEPGVGVSELELKIRALLDRLLYVRPRTKEFLVGYPALMLGAAFALRGIRRIAAPLIVVGSIALVSATNSFCHIHTPLLLSSIRVLNGAIIGCALGMVIYWFVKNVGNAEKQ